MVRTKLVTLTQSPCVISGKGGKARLMRAWSASDFQFGWKGKGLWNLTLPGTAPVSRRDEWWRLPLPLLSHPTSEISFQSPCSINSCSFFILHCDGHQMLLPNYPWRLTFNSVVCSILKYIKVSTFLRYIIPVWRHCAMLLPLGKLQHWMMNTYLFKNDWFRKMAFMWQNEWERSTH